MPSSTWEAGWWSRPLRVDVRRGLDVWGFRDGSVTLDAMRSLRRAFDPSGTINPGRFLTDTA